MTLYEGRRSPSLYVQSLRANPRVDNRMALLVCYRSSDYVRAAPCAVLVCV